MKDSSALRLSEGTTTQPNMKISIEIFAANSLVWVMTDHGLREKRILRIATASRGILGDLTHTETSVNYLFDDGTSRDADEVFASKEELIASL